MHLRFPYLSRTHKPDFGIGKIEKNTQSYTPNIFYCKNGLLFKTMQSALLIGIQQHNCPVETKTNSILSGLLQTIFILH